MPSPPTAVPTAGRSFGGVEFGEASFGPAVPFPLHTTLILTEGCWQCDGPPSALVRFRRDEGEASGWVRSDYLVE